MNGLQLQGILTLLLGFIYWMIGRTFGGSTTWGWYFLLFMIVCHMIGFGKILSFLFRGVFKFIEIPDITLLNQKAPEGFNLWAGEGTGKLTKRGHATGLKKKRQIWLTLNDACQNIITIGGIGSGKTTRVIQPALSQLMQQDCGGLIFDIKGDFRNAVHTLANRHKRHIDTVGVGQHGISLLSGLTPEIAASFMKSTFYLSGSGHGDSAFWIDTATELCKNALGVLSFCPGSYSLEALYRFIFSDTDRKIFLEEANINAAEMDLQSTRLLRSYAAYHENIFPQFDQKVKQGVIATVAQVLTPFQHPSLVDAFCNESTGSANMEEVLSGKIFLVDLPIAHFGLGAKVVYTFIKLRFFNVLQSRPSRPDLNQDRPIFFMCDEYQEIISANKAGLSDLNFWDKSRSAKCIGIISAQSINSFRAAIGDKVLADTVLQNFRQKIFFRTEDLETINFMNQLAGRAEVERTTKTEGSGYSSSGFLGHSSSNTSSGKSVSLQERSPVDAQLIRQLGQNQAIAFYNINGLAADDVVTLKPVFLN